MKRDDSTYRRLNEVSFSFFDFLIAYGEFIPVLPAVIHKSLDAFVLHQVLHGTEAGIGVRWVAGFEVGCESDHGGEEGCVDVLVDVDAFRRDAE